MVFIFDKRKDIKKIACPHDKRFSKNKLLKN